MTSSRASSFSPDRSAKCGRASSFSPDNGVVSVTVAKEKLKDRSKEERVERILGTTSSTVRGGLRLHTARPLDPANAMVNLLTHISLDNDGGVLNIADAAERSSVCGEVHHVSKVDALMKSW